MLPQCTVRHEENHNDEWQSMSMFALQRFPDNKSNSFKNNKSHISIRSDSKTRVIGKVGHVKPGNGLNWHSSGNRKIGHVMA